MLASGKRVNFGSDDALKYHWYETSLLSQAVLKHVVSNDFIFKKSVQGSNRLCTLPRMKKSRALFCINFSCHVTLLLKRKLQHVVTSGSYVGHIRIVLWVE